MKKAWVISGTIASSIVAAGIYDMIKSYPFLTSIKDLSVWIWRNVFNAEIKLWLIIVLILVFYAVYKLPSLINKQPISSKPKYFDYKTDYFGGLKWKWDYEFNTLTGKNEISGIVPLCPTCSTRMHYEYGLLQTWEATCPRCKKHIKKMNDRADIFALIIDNIDKNNFKIE